MAFAALYGESRDAFWLDSGRGGRFSFMGDASGPLAATISYDVRATKLTIEREGATEIRHEPLLDYLDRELTYLRSRLEPSATNLPFDFDCGFAGYLGYELKADCGATPGHPSPHPDAALVFADRLIAFDHAEGHVYLLALHSPDEEAAGEAWISTTASHLASLETGADEGASGEGSTEPPPNRDGEPSPDAPPTPTLRLARSPERYLEDIEVCKQHLLEGESYEICLTNSVEADVSVDPLSLYMELRQVNPAPFASYLRFGDLAVLSSSPERFLRVDGQGQVETKPIKGTCRRGDTPEQDARLAEGLRTSEKNRAENLMIVDLMRNDLGAVCEVGSVEVPALMEVESYETVHQLVSTVRGRLRADASVADCIRSCFPPGSMTGAPKLRTMEILDRLEGRARGVYSGAIGYFGLGGGCDLSVTIRTIVLADGTATVGAGGAIVLQSDAQTELDEALLKARAPLRAIDSAVAECMSARLSTVPYVPEGTGELGAVQMSQAPTLREWGALAERLDAPPFLWPEWTAAWIRAFGEGGGDLQPLESRREGELVAVLPLLRAGSALRSPTNWHTPVFGPLAVDGAARAALLGELFAAPAARIELGNVGGAGTDSATVLEAARTAGRLAVHRELGRSPYIALEGDFEAYESTLSRNRRKALRRHRRKLEQEGELEFEVHDGRAGLEPLLEELFAVEASGWKGERGTAISSRPETRRFYTELAAWAAERGWLRLAFYRLDGRPIACDFALLQGGAWYTLKAGYDESLRAFGPGALFLRDEIAHCCELGVTRIELLGEQDEFKASWTDRATERFQVRAYRRTPAGAARWAAAAATERARPRLRRLKRRLSR